ncbi:hypothetical protein E2562_007705 [Oryza meyeriana var. granulata]|uniref:Uncharacterized protein n=1 Tax=Oryza meyeriana var. granulata TaxID=110450 RepID=A0A6G1EGX0_9ORYZ|nr:hypothetical protein E2562_007705 [Oryza meyeriana var. granulata]
MATKSCQAQAPHMGAPAAERTGGGSRVQTLPPPRRGQIKEQIIKDFAAAVARIIAALARSEKNGGGGGVPVSDDDTDK